MSANGYFDCDSVLQKLGIILIIIDLRKIIHQLIFEVDMPHRLSG